LRAGLPPASLKAAAKSWLPARELADVPADAPPEAAAGDGASGWIASFNGGALKTGGAAFIPPEIASHVPTYA
jgi:hypothetical protein